MRIRRILKNRQCRQCDTFNNSLRRTCMVCRTPMPGVTQCRARTAAVVRWTADQTRSLGYVAFIVLAVMAFVVQHGTLDLFGLMPALAAYGLLHVVEALLDEVAERIAPPGPTWKEAAQALREVAQKLEASENRATAIDELNRHGGVYPITSILRALALHARVEQSAADDAWDVQDALGQERMADALITAAREMDAAVERAWS